MKSGKQRIHHPDRITLSEAVLIKVDQWMNQVKSSKAGVVMSRRDIVNWMLENVPDKLSLQQEKALAQSFYSESRYLYYAAKEIKAAEERGEKLTLKDLETRHASIATSPRRRRPKAAALPEASDTVENFEAATIGEESPGTPSID